MMKYLILVGLSIIPILIYAKIIYKMDKIDKEPNNLLFLLFICGICCSLIALVISMVFKSYFPFLKNSNNSLNFIQTIFKHLIAVALIEESLKWIGTYLITWKNKNFNYVFDGIVYSVCLSLGFALIENIIYGVAYFNYFSFTPLILRAVISIPTHVVFGIIMGYFLGYSKFHSSIKEKIYSILIPIILHFIYDFLLSQTSNWSIIIFIIYTIIIYFLSYFMINKTFKFKKKIK